MNKHKVTASTTGRKSVSSPQMQGNNREIGYSKPPKETQFKPGQSGNPGGRPKGSVKISISIKHSLLRLVPGDPEQRTYAQKITDRLVELAADGDMRAIKEVADRVEGKPAQMVLEKRDGITYSEVREILDRVKRAKKDELTPEDEEWFAS